MLILNFHGVGPLTRTVDDGEADCWLEGAHFVEVLDAVRDLPGLYLTVDDGNASDHELILPALQARNMTAQFFICSGRLDQPTFVSRKAVRELQAADMTIGSHGVSHRPWRGLPDVELATEVVQSRRELEALCGQPVRSAACPFGAYDRRVLRTLRAAGYQQVYTSDGGAASASAWLRPRLTIRRGMKPELLRKRIELEASPLRRSVGLLRRSLKRWR